MSKPNTRMTAMRQRALEAFAEGRADDLSDFSTTALWEVARVQQRKGNRHALAGVLVELFNRTDPDDGTDVPIELRIHLPGMDAHVSETKPDAGRTVSDTPALNLEPSPPPRSDADLVGQLLDRHGTYTGIARALAGAGHKIDRSNLSRIHRDGQTASPDTRAALVALVDREA